MSIQRKTIVVLGGLAESLVNFRGPLMSEMIRRGYRVIACAPSASNEVRNSLSEIGVEYIHIPFDRAGLNPLRDLRSFWAVYRLLRRLKPDVVFGYTIKPVIYGSLAARLAKVKSSYSMITGLGYAFIGDGFKCRLVGSIARFLYRQSLRGNEKVFFQNPDDIRLFSQLNLLRNYQQAALINGSGIDVDAFSVSAFPKKISFLLIARFLKDKGVMEYLEAARIIRAKYPDVLFRLVGWIDENPAAISSEVLKAAECDGIIENLGKLDDVRFAIADSSVYVLPSYREGTPRTVLEAMAMGRPVITTDAPGCRETVVDGVNGYLVPVKSVDGLVRAMELFLGDARRIEEMGNKSRLIAEGKYDVRKVNRAILEYMSL